MWVFLDYNEGKEEDMPKGTRVHRCVEKLKKRKGVNPYAVCQAATGQSYMTGKPIRKKKKKKKASRRKSRSR